MKSYKNLKNQLLKDKKIKKAYNELEPEFAVIQMIIAKRLRAGLTQAQLAKKIGTKQSAIARIESGNANFSIEFLEKMTSAMNAQLSIHIR